MESTKSKDNSNIEIFINDYLSCCYQKKNLPLHCVAGCYASHLEEGFAKTNWLKITQNFSLVDVMRNTMRYSFMGTSQTNLT